MEYLQVDASYASHQNPHDKAALPNAFDSFHYFDSNNFISLAWRCPTDPNITGFFWGFRNISMWRTNKDVWAVQVILKGV